MPHGVSERLKFVLSPDDAGAVRAFGQLRVTTSGAFARQLHDHATILTNSEASAA